MAFHWSGLRGSVSSNTEAEKKVYVSRCGSAGEGPTQGSPILKTIGSASSRVGSAAARGCGLSISERCDRAD